MNAFRLIVASLAYHWRMHLAVACGVIAGTAVLSGALLVGDSMRGSLRGLTLERLGRIDDVLVTDRFFREKLADEMSARLAGDPDFNKDFTAAVPVILLRASLASADPESDARANQVQLVGCDERFWKLGGGGPSKLPGRREIVLNQPLAERLDVEADDWVILRLPRATPVPADNPLGRKKDTVGSHRLRVTEVIPADGLGRFGLRPTQQRPLGAFMGLAELQDELERPGGANALLVAGRDADQLPDPRPEAHLGHMLSPRLADYGIRVEQTERGYLNVTTERMIFDPAAEAEVLQSLDKLQVQPALTYLANTIALADGPKGGGIPYSTITALDPVADPPLGPLVTTEDKPVTELGDGDIVLNTWAADDLGAKPEDTIRVTYFEPETADGTVRETTAEFRLKAIVRLEAAADDPALTPEVAGVTDRLKMDEWNPPFPFDANRIRNPEDNQGPGNDEAYWDQHGATPKAFVSLAAGRKLWKSRFGRTTSLRVKPSEGMTAESLQAKLELELDPARLGFAFQPVKRQGLAASAGTTPFSGLFIGFSFFIIVSAVMLVGLLFRLGVERRAEEVGILLAVGTTRRKVAGLLAAEGLIVTAAASLVGLGAGLGYAALMLLGLRTEWLWRKAVVTPFLELHVTGLSLAIGYASGVVVASGAILLAVRRIGRVPPRRLLAGRTDDAGSLVARRPWIVALVSWTLFGLAVLSAAVTPWVSEAARAGIFFGAGSMVLAAVLGLAWTRLRSGATGAAVAPGGGNLLRMAARNAARNPGRSTLSIGLVAAACFLIVAVSAFHLDPSQQKPTLESGNGGFALVAECTQPVLQPLDSPEGRFELGFSDEESAELADARVFALRVQPGEDASCLNLYQPRRPTMLGLPDEFIRRGGFVFASHQSGSKAEGDNPWLLLKRDLGTDDDATPLVPVVLDDATAKYSLHLGLGKTLDVTDSRGRTVRLEIVGLLGNSIFQGSLLVAEKDLLAMYPGISGHRFFLVETPPEETTKVRDLLESRLGDYGLAAETAGRRLAGFLTVQNTYLSTFQTLGGLGLLLGTVGLAAVELRNVLERRRELALMRAVGFRRGQLAWMVMLENGFLLLAGLGCGVVAAAVAVLPHFFSGQAGVPWDWLGGTLGAVLLVGLVAGLAAVRAVVAAPLLEALRGE